MNLTRYRLVWASMLFSTLVELGIVLWGDFDRHVEVQPAVFGVAGIALAIVIAGLVLPGRLYATALARLSLPIVESPVQEPARDYRTAAGSHRVFRDPAEARSAILRAYTAPFIIGLAFAESIAILGLVVAQGRLAPSSWGLPYFAVAWALLALRFPRAAVVLGPAERIYAARRPI